MTETTFTDGEFGTIYRSFEYTPETDAEGNVKLNKGNDLIAETDAQGNITSYTVNELTSRNEEVIDRLGNKTVYEYNSSGQTTSVTNKNANNVELASVEYEYDAFDNLTSIKRGDEQKYTLKYDAFHNLETISVNDTSMDESKKRDLIHYTYKAGNGRLKEVTYANGDEMKATYNSIGQMTAEKWYDACENLVAHYKYVYDGKGNIVRSIDILGEKEYNYIYEQDNLVRAIEYYITVDDEIVTSKTVLNTIRYHYNSEGKMTKKVISDENGTIQTIYCENNENSSVAKFTVGNQLVTTHSKTDSFGRKEFDEVQFGTGFVSRQFHYHEGEVTDNHIRYSKLKSTPTTQLVSQISFYGGRTITYEYDKEERITKVVDSEGYTTQYTYDALGQLLLEKVNGTIVNYMEYDNYGNIARKNGVEYCYCDNAWHDLLTCYGNHEITYDAQGNPTSYLGHTLTWEKGRQLKSFDSNTYTYNANGIRTSKTVNGVEHTYILDGTKILKETWCDNSLVPLYDNEDSVCGIIYNDTPYYFQKNLQGDIIGIVDEYANVVAKYTYDAWGKIVSIKDGNNADVSSDDTHIANINPYRYRGYYYDAEIGLYYVSSRYYDPEIGRWLNSDDAQFVSFSESLLSSNLFCYCHNSSINNIDENGKWLARVIGAVAVGAIFATLAYVVLKVVNAILKSVGRSPLSKKITTLITVGVGALGAVIGAILGPSFLVKYAPNLLKAINQIEKTKFSIKTIKPNSHGNIFGINISNTLIIMLHYPHAGKNEWNFHVQVEIHLFGKKQKEIGRWILLDVNKSTWEKWRRYFGNK